MNTTGRMSQADLPQYDRNTSRVNGVRVFVTSCGMNVSVIEMSNPTCNTLNTIVCHQDPGAPAEPIVWRSALRDRRKNSRSEEHTSELQSQFHLVCRLLL